METGPWAEGKHHLTTTYAWFLARWAKRLSWPEVAEMFRTTWEHVFDVVQMAVTWGQVHRNGTAITAIGLDEIQWHRGHHYLTLVYQLDAGGKRLLWIGEHRTVKTLLRFFRWLGKDRSTALRFICSDMWKPYLRVVAKKAGDLKAQGYAPVLKHTRWLLLKRPEHLTEKQEPRLAELLRYNLRAVRSYLLREDFQFFWTYVSPTWAGRFLDRWCTRTLRSQIEPMKKVARMLLGHRELLLNGFRAKGTMSSGTVEGFNNKAKLTTTRAFGFRTFRAIEIALYHTLGAPPEPETTHKFC